MKYYNKLIRDGKEYKTVIVDEREYLNVYDFAEIVGVGASTIRKLSIEGNSIRKLKVEKLYNRLYVPIEELFDFPFVAQGRSFLGDRKSVARFFIHSYKDGCNYIAKEISVLNRKGEKW